MTKFAASKNNLPANFPIFRLEDIVVGTYGVGDREDCIFRRLIDLMLDYLNVIMYKSTVQVSEGSRCVF